MVNSRKWHWQGQFQFITHINNLKSILEKGILSHNKIEEKRLNPEKISDKDIVDSRKVKQTPDKKSLWDYVNVYFRAKNAMLFRMLRTFGPKNIAILGIKRNILDLPDTFITTGNAANIETNIRPTSQIKGVLSELYPELGFEWWKTGGDSKRKTMAECLVQDCIPPNYIDSIYVANEDAKDQIREKLGQIVLNIDVIVDPDMFFESSTRLHIPNNILIKEGDMFFSQMQTLAVSVNTIGVMGKGLASRARYQFPDLFVFYEDLCKNGKLKMGVPVIYKRDISISETLGLGQIESEEPTWFLLFPTKTHYSYDSDFNGIENGLIWLKENYKSIGITSLALPALGCGLGRLRWEEIGPLMIKYLKDFDIPVWIYLPREGKIDEKHLTKEYLLNSSS